MLYPCPLLAQSPRPAKRTQPRGIREMQEVSGTWVFESISYNALHLWLLACSAMLKRASHCSRYAAELSSLTSLYFRFLWRVSKSKKLLTLCYRFFVWNLLAFRELQGLWPLLMLLRGGCGYEIGEIYLFQLAYIKSSNYFYNTNRESNKGGSLNLSPPQDWR